MNVFLSRPRVGRAKCHALSGDDLVRLNTQLLEMLQKALDRWRTNIAIDSLIADQAIAIGRCRIDGKQEG